MKTTEEQELARKSAKQYCPPPAQNKTFAGLRDDYCRKQILISSGYTLTESEFKTIAKTEFSKEPDDYRKYLEQCLSDACEAKETIRRCGYSPAKQIKYFKSWLKIYARTQDKNAALKLCMPECRLRQTSPKAIQTELF